MNLPLRVKEQKVTSHSRQLLRSKQDLLLIKIIKMSNLNCSQSAKLVIHILIS